MVVTCAIVRRLNCYVVAGVTMWHIAVPVAARLMLNHTGLCAKPRVSGMRICWNTR
jgi:hypothetical protein